MTRTNTKSITVIFLVVLALPMFAIAQERNPFSSTTSTIPVAEATRKPEKVVIHTPTLDLCFHWFEMNIGIVEIQRKISQTKIKIETLNPKSHTEVSAKLQKQLTELRDVSQSTKAKLDQIPLDTTFDLERWELFKRQLAEMRMRESERKHLSDHITLENERLQNENRKLRDEISQLKSGR